MADVSLDYDDFLIMIEKMLHDELGSEDSPLHLFYDEDGKAKLVIQGDAVIRRATDQMGIENTLLVDVTGLTYGSGKQILFEVGKDAALLSPPLTAEGNITVENSNASMAVTNGTRKVSLLIGSNGINRGVYDSEKKKWLLYSDDTDINIITNSSIGKLNVNDKAVSMSGHTHILDDLPQTVVSQYLYVEDNVALAKGFIAQPTGTTRVYRFSSAGCNACFGISSAALLVLCKTSSTVGDGVFVSNGSRKLAHVRLTNSNNSVTYSMDYATTTNTTGTIE